MADAENRRHSCCDPAPTVLSGAGICLIVLGYTMFGAFTFMTAQTVEKLWKITEDLNILYRDNWTRLAEEEILKFQDSLIRKYGGPNQTDRRHRWNFASSFLYSLTLITTIGKSNIV
ncbi:hypothetical protein QTP88_006279 [Uroleucon formosanum]